MKKINLNFPILNLDGTPIKDESGQDLIAGKLLGNVLVGASSGDALKYYDWAVSMHGGKEILVDASDFKKILDFVEDSKVFTNLSKAQIIKCLNSATQE